MQRLPQEELRAAYSLLPNEDQMSNQAVIRLKRRLAEEFRAQLTMLAPYKGRVYDPCCGSAGMFVQSVKFVEGHGWRIGDIAVYVRSHSLPISQRLLRRSDYSHDAL